MRINVIAVGKVKGSLSLSVDEYVKMITKYAEIEITELKEEFIPQNASQSQIESALTKEGDAILKKIGDKDYVYVLSPDGKMMSSTEFSAHLDTAFALGQSRVNFVIGSSNGLAKRVYERANTILSVSKMTFPHQLFRVILLEQIFRAFKIANNETYHK